MAATDFTVLIEEEAVHSRTPVLLKFLRKAPLGGGSGKVERAGQDGPDVTV